jgi:hypothetical protein
MTTVLRKEVSPSFRAGIRHGFLSLLGKVNPNSFVGLDRDIVLFLSSISSITHTFVDIGDSTAYP